MVSEQHPTLPLPPAYRCPPSSIYCILKTFTCKFAPMWYDRETPTFALNPGNYAPKKAKTYCLLSLVCHWFDKGR